MTNDIIDLTKNQNEDRNRISERPPLKITIRRSPQDQAKATIEEVEVVYNTSSEEEEDDVHVRLKRDEELKKL